MSDVKQNLNAGILKSGEVHSSKQQQHLSFFPCNRIEMKKCFFIFLFLPSCIEIMNASAIMHKAAINNNNEYAGNSSIEGVGVGV